jgi:hypothetical protein
MCSSMYVRKLSQFVCIVISAGIVDLLIACVLIVAITGEWSDDTSKLDSTYIYVVRRYAVENKQVQQV